MWLGWHKLYDGVHWLCGRGWEGYLDITKLSQSGVLSCGFAMIGNKGADLKIIKNS